MTMVLIEFIAVVAALGFVVVVLRLVIMPEKMAMLQQKAQSIFSKASPSKQMVYRAPSEKRQPLDKIQPLD